jgi:hypothetical protein
VTGQLTTPCGTRFQLQQLLHTAAKAAHGIEAMCGGPIEARRAAHAQTQLDAAKAVTFQHHPAGGDGGSTKSPEHVSASF